MNTINTQNQSRNGYGYVTEKGFVAFAHDISEGPWADVDVDAHDNDARTLGESALDAPRSVAWKLRATWAIATLRDALGASPEVLAGLDDGWDSTQRRLYHAISGALEDPSPEVREAATRLSGALLAGNGVAQTGLSYDDEVDFGRHQVELMTHGALATDTATLGLTALRDRIDETTEALAKGIGRGPGEQRTMTRSKRIRVATAACASHFNGIHSEIVWVMSHTPPGAARARLERMLAPFRALLERYPAPAGAPAMPEAPAMPAMPETPETPEAPPVAAPTPA